MAQTGWKPYESLTQAPTNLKEAIDWVLRVTGKDGKKNEKKDNALHCLCYLAKAVKDLLYDAKDPGFPGPHPDRYWSDLLLEQEKDIAQPVLQDLGLLSGGSTGTRAASSTCAGGTEVIKTLIDHLALGLQKWVGWKDERDDCCLKGAGGESKGIGKKCKCAGGTGGGVTNCCSGGTASHECETCGTSDSASNKCYQSAYKKDKALWIDIVSGTTGAGGSGSAGSAVGGKGGSGVAGPPADLVKTAQEVHLLARIFLGSVCLIWSGLSQLGFLTKEGSGGNKERWSNSNLHDETVNLGSFMAAMGYDLDRLNQDSSGGKGNGEFVQKLLSGTDIKWQEFKNGADKNSVAEYYSTIYDKAKEALKKDNKTESICNDYPLLVLHILASGYFRAGSAGANKIMLAPSAPTKKEETPSSRKPRHPRTIREILYWLSALPYSQGYCGLVTRMQHKYPPKDGVPNETVDQIELYDTSASKASTTLQRKDITHYLMAACGYCPLVLIGIQGTIEKEVDKAQPAAQGSSGGSAGTAQSTNKCPEHKKNPSAKRCKLGKDAAQASAAPPAASANGELKEGEVCYGGYHLAVKDFGPLHGMYANGLFGFQMDGSPAQCLDQLRVYVYHCFYQLYFLRKQCKVGVESGAVLGWNSCRYGSGVSGSSTNDWRCTAETQGAAGKCKCMDSTSTDSPLMSFLCDGPGKLVCFDTVGKGVDDYPPIETHWTTKDDNLPGHFGTKELDYPKLCPVPMGWQAETGTGGTQKKENHFKDLTTGTHKTEQLTGAQAGKATYPIHCTGRTLSLLLEYYCDPEKCQSGTLVVLLRLLACITPTVPRTLGDLFGFYYYVVYIGGNSASGGEGVNKALGIYEKESKLHMASIGGGPDAVVQALTKWNGDSSSGGGCNHSTTDGSLKTLFGCSSASGGTNKCCPYLSPLSGQQYGQLSPAMAGTYLSWLVYLIEGFRTAVS
ncbi:variant erythrocyte surface antigen-1 beta subunit [Babesia bovis T2Bo]|uniref:variant erythrocyte surface antigen-1 beta subunit n=1 Tax=Babesia bovis T2Bo TaxID=484906 RepID=UPI001C35CBD8|nr:variant erythrocyte surface antigen-1 beta subunit [Babesia bovis T2Bo]EDO07578.2 variant erythrocyte surface antigen-1 beta subunit [Babesia bovis T2Bo]